MKISIFLAIVFMTRMNEITNEEMFHRNCILDLDSNSLLVNFLVSFLLLFTQCTNVPLG